MRSATCLLILSFCVSMSFAQPADEATIEDMFARAETALEQAQLDEIDLLSPRTMREAEDGLAEAASLRERESDNRLVRIQLLRVIDDVEKARENARTARKLLTAALIARKAVIESGAVRTANGSWEEAEERLLVVIRDVEAGRGEQAGLESEDIAGVYWAVRREGLRQEILGSAYRVMQEAERKKADRMTPTLIARAQQAIARAEAAVTQEKLEESRIQAKQAEDLARQAIAMIDYIQQAQSEKFPWETALLPYDDLLKSIAGELGGAVNFAPGGAKTLSQFKRLIEEHDGDYERKNDSLRIALRETSESLEAMLTESQTNMADAQHKIIELEKRVTDLEGVRAETRDKLAKRQEIARLVTIAQSEFQPSEAMVLQDELGNVVIRVIGIRFASGRSSLSATQIALIGKIAKAIDHFSGAKITVEGHTDSQGGEANNQKISERRADAVAIELAEKLGISASSLTIAGYGETRPIADNRTKSGRAQNRRIDVLLEIP